MHRHGARRQTRGGPVVWVGDSIIYGNASLPLTPPVRLARAVVIRAW